MKVLRNQDRDNLEGQCYRFYPGSDRVIPSDLPSSGFASVHPLPLCHMLLQSILSVNLTLASPVQNEEVKNLTEASIDHNEEVKKISAWAAILFAPTLIRTAYGMNFEHMPELR
jgi:magnesium transporter